MRISYLVSCHNEVNTLHILLSTLIDLVKDGIHDEVIILDDFSDNNDTVSIIKDSCSLGNGKVKHFQHSLNANYGEHKNWGTKQCTGNWIFQIDGDELPPENILGENLDAIISMNPNVELIYVPRINDYRGVTEAHARQWGWRLTPSPGCENRPIVNWPDYQGRIYKNDPERIRWDRKLHEKIVGHDKYSCLPDEEDYAIYHDKTIEKQIETNLRYNKIFSAEDNMGHKVI